MVELHCAYCGGFISQLRYVSYRPAPDAVVAAPLCGDLCSCVPPVVYGPPPGYLSSPGMPIPSRPSA
jgi:hypothetical protein